MNQKKATITISLDQDSIDALSKMAKQERSNDETFLLSLIKKALREENCVRAMNCDVNKPADSRHPDKGGVSI